MVAQYVDVAEFFGQYPEIEDVQWVVTWGALFGDGVPADDVTLELADEFVWKFDELLDELFPEARVVVAHEIAEAAPSHYVLSPRDSPDDDEAIVAIAWQAMDAASEVERELLGSEWWKSKRLAARLRVVA